MKSRLEIKKEEKLKFIKKQELEIMIMKKNLKNTQIIIYTKRDY